MAIISAIRGLSSRASRRLVASAGDDWKPWILGKRRVGFRSLTKIEEGSLRRLNFVRVNAVSAKTGKKTIGDFHVCRADPIGSARRA